MTAKMANGGASGQVGAVWAVKGREEVQETTKERLAVLVLSGKAVKRRVENRWFGEGS